MEVPEIIRPPPSLPGQGGCNLFQTNANAPVFVSLVTGPLGGQLSTIYRKFALCFQLTFGVTLYLPTRTVIL